MRPQISLFLSLPIQFSSRWDIVSRYRKFRFRGFGEIVSQLPTGKKVKEKEREEYRDKKRNIYLGPVW